MTEIAADEQDLAKALDSVANAASGGDALSVSPSNTATATLSSVELPPIVPPNSPVAPSAYGTISSAIIEPSPLFSTPPVEPPQTSSYPVVSPITPLSSDNSTDFDATTSDSAVTTVSDNNPTEPVVVSGPLADIKNDALNELRPLVDKLNVSSEEKFDTYLLLIRSTDDESLIAPAHEAAKAIEDEARRAEALLDIIKEIDYLSRPKVTEE